MMRFRFVKFILAAAAVVLFALPAVAAEKEDVAAELTARKIVKGVDGKETFESAETAKPGDIIEYRAFYRNKGKNKVTSLLATIPVPAGTEYIPGSASPPKVTASVDGKEFGPLPLKRKVKLPSGKTEMQDIPYGEYRFIRWELKTLAPAQSVPVSMRVKISTSAAKEPAKQ